jgi:protein-L-isoaspartate(D-aspartate) O-methyltransferase
MPHGASSSNTSDERLALIFWITAGLALLGFLIACHRSHSGPPDYDKLRENMVKRQIAARGIKDAKVLAAMRKVPRHLFIPEDKRILAYEDHPVGIGHGQTISQPYIVALMTELLELDESKRVLEIGTGSGYQAAILAELAKEVYTIEIVEPLAKSAARTLQENGYPKIQVRCGDGYRGWPEAAPFDAIIVTAAPDHVPQALVDQLKVGGIMVIPVGVEYQELLLIRKTSDGITKEDIIPVRFVPMTGEALRKKMEKK